MLTGLYKAELIHVKPSMTGESWVVLVQAVTPVRRPSVVDPAKLAYAVHLRDQEDQSISEIVKATGITRSSLYRYLRPVHRRC
ncbi:helix-turn-helix domain-containing protein [Arthrobacter sp. UYEF36]|uniref:helix-turn-helix domain-containing protein n=1 Tax=Arthrobacter sp. UYEF36 TaxID=1756366 RepID=UPI00339A07AE